MGAMGFGASDACCMRFNGADHWLGLKLGEVASFGLARLEEEVKEQILS